MKNPYVNYYVNQAGTGNVSFSGVRYQRGNGFLGRWFGKALTKLLPVLKYVGKQGLKTAINVGSDVLAGETLKESGSKRIKETAKEVLEDGVKKIESLQSGSGKRSKTRNQNLKQKSKKKPKKVKLF